MIFCFSKNEGLVDLQKNEPAGIKAVFLNYKTDISPCGFPLLKLSSLFHRESFSHLRLSRNQKNSQQLFFFQLMFGFKIYTIQEDFHFSSDTFCFF